MATQLERLKRRLRITDTEQDELLEDLITDATAFAQGYTGQSALPDDAQGVVTELAVISYNRMGMEGQSEHTEGDLSLKTDSLPLILKVRLDGMRIGKVG